MVEIFFFIHRKRESVSRTEQREKKNTSGCLFFGMWVLCLFNTVCSVFSVSCWQCSGAFKVPVLLVHVASRRWICRLHLDSPRERIQVTAIYCSQVLCSGWWCYTGGGRGESSTPKQCKAIWVHKSTETNKKIKIWSSILIGTVVEVASSDWPMGVFGLRVEETPLSSRFLWLS